MVLAGRSQIHGILDREDDRLLVVVGPCSVHDAEATLEYAGRLGERAAGWKDELLVTMRVYFEKPRTTTGWKGLINDPHLDGSGDVNYGLALARQVLLGVLATGLCFPLVERLYNAAPRGAWTLPQLLDLPYGLVVFGVVIVALAGFAATERIEARA